MRRVATPSRSTRLIFCEALEARQLMSLTIEVRNADGSASATATSVGQVLNLQVLAVVSSSNNDPTQDGFQDASGSFISTAGGEHSVAGSLLAANIAPFKAFGSSPGVQQDLNGDGNLDDGSNSAIDTTGYFDARAASIQTADTGTIVGNTLVFKIATLSYTVTHLNEGGQTQINFVPRPSQAADAAAWAEDISTAPNNGQQDNTTGTFQAGTPFTVSDPAIITAPTAVADTATVAINTPTVINELKNDDVIQPLNPASVILTVGVSHGTTLVQSNGSILYTPTQGYLGADSFTYTVADIDGRVSNPATVNITVVPTPAPTANSFASTTLLDQPVTVNVLAHASSVATLVPSSVLVITAPTHGTAVAQSDGSILYTPANAYVGTDTFSYTVGDSNGETSAVATVTMTVIQPIPPTANNDSFNIIAGTPTTLNVMANDVEGSITSNTTVHLTSNASHGTLVVQSDQTVLYTPTAGYTGTDSFTYVLVDALDEPSREQATVTLTITAPAAPTAGNVTAPVLSGQAGTINVLSSITSGAPIVPSSVKIVTPPVNGHAVANSDGSISYTAVAGFVGSDSFTYTATDSNGTTTAPGTVTVDVGTSISNAKGAAHSIAFTDAAGGTETVSLNSGVAEIFFTGTGSLTVAKNGKATVTGPGLGLANLSLSGTSRASSLSIRGLTKTPVSLGGITDASPLGSLVGSSVNVTGDVNLNSAGSITLGTLSNATITIGAGLPARVAWSTGAVSNTSLSSTAPIASLNSTSWTGSGTISAPSINSLAIKTGGLAANVSSGAINSISIGGPLTGNITAATIRSLKVTGAITGSTISTTGNIGSIVAPSIAGSTISAGVTAGTTLATASAGDLGNATIANLHITGSFASTDLLAGKITAASVAAVTTANAGSAFGIATKNLGGFAGTFASTPLHLRHSVLINEEVLQAYLNQQGAAFGDFNIQLLS